ncbi:unnamed protein product, partial [Tetraodon nigroviridis]
MKKQFNRMRQLASQNLGRSGQAGEALVCVGVDGSEGIPAGDLLRAEKTEVLREDLLQAEVQMCVLKGMGWWKCEVSVERRTKVWNGFYGGKQQPRRGRLERPRCSWFGLRRLSCLDTSRPCGKEFARRWSLTSDAPSPFDYGTRELIEKRMELVRMVSHNSHKRLTSCLQGQLGTDAEKRHKKLPLTALSQTMQEGGGHLGDESLIGKMMEACGEAEGRLATELMQYEVQVERDILDPLNQLAEVEIPNILKHRKQLAKLVLDYDSAKTRWYQATKSTNQAMAAKVDSLKDEMEEALNKVEACKDQLSVDLYSFASKEGDYARYFVLLLEAQADYHRRSLAALESALPTIQMQQDSWMEKPAFGTALEEHLKRSNREIALPIEACVMMLLETGMKEEGLFRIAAGASKLKKLKAALDCSTSQLEEFYSDPHAVAGALKSYLRELPEPLMTFGLYDEWTQASSVSDPDKRLQALWVTCNSLPKPHKANLRYLVKFLSKLAQDSEVNKMTPSNIAIVLGPNLLWAKTEGTLAEMAAATSVHVVAIIEPIIQHADWFFPE